MIEFITDYSAAQDTKKRPDGQTTAEALLLTQLHRIRSLYPGIRPPRWSTLGYSPLIIILRIISPHKIPARETDYRAVNQPLYLASADARAIRPALCVDFGLKRGELSFQIGLL